MSASPPPPGGTAARPSPSTGTVLILRALVGVAVARGVEAGAFLEALGVTPEVLKDDEARVPSPVLNLAWLELERRTGDPFVGLRAGEAARVGDFDVLDYVCASSATMAAACERVSRYYRLIHDGLEMKLVQDAHGPRLIHHVPGAPPGAVSRHATEFVFAMMLTRSRTLTKVAWVPREVWFHHPRPEDISEHRRLFGCPLNFGRETNAVVFAPETLALPVSTADPALCAILERHVADRLARIPEKDPLLTQLQRLLVEGMREGDFGIERAAERLGMTPRSLQRRLSDQGTTFQRFLDELRCELARGYLGERRMSLAEVAFLLGFSEASAFHRAFKRWTGTTPREYRASGQAA